SYTVSTNFNCTASGSAVDSVFCLPQVVAPPSFSICPGMATNPQTFTATVANGGPAFTVWYTNYPITNTGMTIADTLGFDVFPSYTTIPKNLSCNPVSDMVYGIAVSNYCIGNVDSLQITVYPTPYLAHMPTDSICANQSLTVASFTACPANSTIAWTNNNTSIGLGASGTGNITPNPFTGTNTTNTLNIAQINAVPTANGCVGNDSSFTIVVKPLPTMTVSSYTACPADAIPSATITTNPATGVNFTWVNDNSNIGLALSGTGAQTAYTAPANNTLANVAGTLTYTPTYNGCTGTTATETIVIKPTPFVDPIPPAFYCPNQVTNPVNFTCQPTGGTPVFTYTIPGGLGQSGTGNLPSFTTINAGTTSLVTTFTVNATLNNCEGPNSTFNITVYPNPIAKFIYKPLVCVGSPMLFTDESVAYGGLTLNSWQWDMDGDGIIDVNGPTPQYLYTTAGQEMVTLLVGTSSVPSCTAQTTEPVFVNPKPVADFVGVNLQGCPDPVLNTAYTDLSSISSGNIVSWNWNFGNGQTSNLHFPPPQAYTNSSHDTPMYYSTSLSVVSDSGCTNTKVKTNYVEVYPTPVADFSWGPTDADIDQPTIHFVNEAIGASPYLPAQTFGPFGVEYYLGDTYNSANNYVQNNTTFSHNYSDPDYNDVFETYYVTQWVINSYGCRDSITKPVEIKPIFTFYIPNAYTPNGDNKNEGFKGIGIGIDNSTYNLWVFDRWGLMIYHANDIDKAWDGHMLGHEDKPVLQEDVYVWKVSFNDIFGQSHQYHGTVTLVK
ncbi:MAG TPA: gliding motility-associated C-terminal domain-containing protein, partial [Bacteroidia bacterium]|nr:gliding motility-associated C-terminal domain-containing protein [Bacteroidia bacterium]